MIRVLRGFAGITAILLLAAGVLHAADFCLDDQVITSYVVVGRGFKPPKKDTCKVFIGFVLEGNDPTTGTACTSSDGTTLNFTLTTSFPELSSSEVFMDTITLAMPSLSGTDQFTDFVGGVVRTGSVGFVGKSCTGKTIPAAATEGGGASTEVRQLP
jgi:hypothetical protein